MGDGLFVGFRNDGGSVDLSERRRGPVSLKHKFEGELGGGGGLPAHRGQERKSPGKGY